MSDLKIFIPVLLVCLSGAGWTITTLFSTVKAESELKAKEELRQEYDKKYEGVISDYIALRVECEAGAK